VDRRRCTIELKRLWGKNRYVGEVKKEGGGTTNVRWSEGGEGPEASTKEFDVSRLCVGSNRRGDKMGGKGSGKDTKKKVSKEK